MPNTRSSRAVTCRTGSHPASIHPGWPDLTRYTTTAEENASSSVALGADESVVRSRDDAAAWRAGQRRSDPADGDGRSDPDESGGGAVAEPGWGVVGDNGPRTQSVIRHAYSPRLGTSWQSTDAFEDAAADQEQAEDEDEDFESAERPESSPLEDPRRRGFYYPSADDDGHRRRQREQERDGSSSALRAKAAVRGVVLLTLVLMLFSVVTVLTGAAVIVRENEQANQPGIPPGSSGASGAPAKSPGSQCEKATAGSPSGTPKGSGTGDGSDGTSSSGSDAGTGMPPGYLDEPGQVPGELPLPIGDGEVIPVASCVTKNPPPSTGGTGSGGATGSVAGTISEVTPACTSNTGGSTGDQGGVQTDAIVRPRRATTAAADAQTGIGADSQGLLTSGQEAFGARLVADTCLNPQVVIAWMRSEENGPAAQSRQLANNNNWLNIGYFDSGTGAIAFDRAFAAPISGADLTARFLEGTWGGASAKSKTCGGQHGIRGILATVGQSAEAQIAAIQASGWATSCYPDLVTEYEWVSGITLAPVAAGDLASASGTGGTLTLAELTNGLATVTPSQIAQLTSQDLVNAVPELEAAFTGSAVQTTAVMVPAGSGPVGAQRMLAAARAVIGSQYNQGNHDAVSDSPATIMQLGTDCSGFVSYLMGPNGAGLWSQTYVTNTMSTAPNLELGTGTAGHYVTIYNNPLPGNSGHVFIDIDGQWFEDAGGVGVHQMDASEVQAYFATGLYTQIFHPAGM